MLEQIIREKAYQIWENEGYPEGRAEAHWEMARLAVAPIARKPAKRIAKPRKKKAKA
jgi:hypothetical protein